MFTGIIEEIGTIKGLRKGSSSMVLTIQGERIFSDLHVGDSVSVNGVCLTASSIHSNTFTADVMNETLSRSSLGELSIGSHVNLERAMAANGRFGGHIVSGHIDGIGKVLKIERDDNAIRYTIDTKEKITRYIVEKGSIAIDGISLTVAKVSSNRFMVSIIPHTMEATILPEKRIGSIVNLENDLIGKYVEKLLDKAQENDSKNTITRDFLLRNGY